MMKFDQLVGPKIFPAAMNRYQDDEKNQVLKAALPDIDGWLKGNLGDKKFMGGDNPMYIDMYVYVLFERMALLENSPMHYAWEALDMKNLMPTVLAFVQRFREHPKMSKHVVNPACNNLHLEDILSKEPGVKAPLSIDYLTPLDG